MYFTRCIRVRLSRLFWRVLRRSTLQEFPGKYSENAPNTLQFFRRGVFSENAPNKIIFCYFFINWSFILVFNYWIPNWSYRCYHGPFLRCGPKTKTCILHTIWFTQLTVKKLKKNVYYCSHQMGHIDGLKIFVILWGVVNKAKPICLL